MGCGGGILAEALAQAGAQVTGLDLSAASLQTAKMHGHESGLKVNYQNLSIEDFAAANPASQDVVCCLEMLEHVPEPGAVIAACALEKDPDRRYASAQAMADDLRRVLRREPIAARPVGRSSTERQTSSHRFYLSC